MLKGKKILIAGAGGLIGAHIAAASLKSGASVIAADIDTELVQKRLGNLGVTPSNSSLSIYPFDITNEKEVVTLFSTMQDVTGAVNCTYPRNKSYGTKFFDVTLESFNENVSLHLGSAFLFSQQCAKYFMKTKQDFSLVNLASIYGVVAPTFSVYDGTPMTMPVEYAAIKSAIIQLTKYLCAYVKDSRFRVNTVSPGGILDGQPEKFLEQYRAQTNGKGMLDVEDITNSILFLLSDKASYLTGQNMIIDDGFTV